MQNVCQCFTEAQFSTLETGKLRDMISISLMDPDLIELSHKETIKSTDESCYSVSWRDNDILYATENDVVVFNNSNKTRITALNMPYCHCVRQTGGFAMAVLCDTVSGQNKRMREVRLGRYGGLFAPDALICQFEQEVDDLFHISIDSNLIATCDADNHEIKVFSFKGEQVMSIGSSHLKGPWGVLLRGTVLLVTDFTDGCLYKFNLEPNSEPVWECRNLESPTGICMDSKGFIYVASDDASGINLISPQGMWSKSCLAQTSISFGIRVAVGFFGFQNC